jgi:hypothetical protein
MVRKKREKKRAAPKHVTANPSANANAWLRWQEPIETAISEKFDSVGLPDDTSIKLFLKDLENR